VEQSPAARILWSNAEAEQVKLQSTGQKSKLFVNQIGWHSAEGSLSGCQLIREFASNPVQPAMLCPQNWQTT